MKRLILIFCLMAFNLNAQMPDFADLADKTLPSVVTITALVDGKEILGSGFVIDETGLILTNAHVVFNATKIDVSIEGEQSFQASLKGSDDKLDLALLKIEPFELLKPAKFADSEKVRVGQWVLAIGNPFGLGNSLSAGIISAKSRDIDMGIYDNFLQTDAIINMGNSGGPLFDLNGDVVGINTAMFSENIKNSGVGFALPSNLAKWAVDELKKNGKIKRGWIGLQIQAEKTQKKGVIISSFAENSPALKSGLEIGDVILKIDDVEINSPKDLSRVIASSPIGQKIKVQISRTNQTMIKDIEIAEMVETKEPLLKDIETCALMGLEINNQTLEVVYVENGSDAHIKGIQKSDIIKSLDNQTVLNCADITTHILENTRIAKNEVMLKIISNGENTHFVELKL